MQPFEISLGPRIRMSPYFQATVEAGVTAFTVYNHMYLPTSYGDSEEEYRRLTERAAVWDVAAQRQVEIAGADAGSLVVYLSARDLSGMGVGEARYAPLCDHDGRLLNDPVVLRVDGERWWVSLADGDMLPYCRAVAAERGLDVRVSEPDVSPLAVQGPAAAEVVGSLLGGWVRDLGHFRFRRCDLEGIPLWLGRSGWSRQDGFELYLCDGSRGHELWNRVLDAGRSVGIGPGAPHPVERLEGALLSFRTDTEADTDPYEAGLGRWVDLDREADFVGKQALVERRAAGPVRTLVGILIDGPAISPIRRPWAVMSGPREVGRLRAAAHSWRLGQNIGVALVPPELTAPGTALVVVGDDGRRAAQVTELPFSAPRRDVSSMSKTPNQVLRQDEGFRDAVVRVEG